MAAWFAFAPSGHRMVTQSVSEFKEYDTEQLAKLFDVKEDACLFIKSTTYSASLNRDEKPLLAHPELILNKKYVSFQRPECFLFAKPVTEASNLALIVRVTSNSPSKIPDYFVTFPTDEFKSKKGIDVKTKIITDFELAVTSTKITLKGSEIKDDEDAITILETAKLIGFDATMELADSGLAKIKQRKYIVEEIISSEETYLSDLFSILNHWKGTIVKKNLIPEAGVNILFKDIPAILGSQKAFLEEMKATGHDYGAKVAEVFLEFAPAFKHSEYFVANYPSIVEVLNTYENKPRTMKHLRRLQEQSRGRDLHSFMITPVQRMPRYILFLRDLMKQTPRSHPDFELLESAFNVISSVTKQFDATAEKAKAQAFVMELQQSITNGYVFLDTRRDLITHCSITFEQNVTAKGEIYLFNDLIMMVKKTKEKKVTVVYDSPVTVFRYKNQWPTLNSFTVDCAGKPYLKGLNRKKTELAFSFDEAGEEDAFFFELSKLQDSARAQSKARYAIQWDNIDMKTQIFPFIRPKAVCIDDVIYVFSGDNSRIDLYFVTDENMTHLSALPQGIHDISIVAVDKFIYIWSVDTLYKYDPFIARKLEPLQLSQTITPRKGVSLVLYHDFIIMFGGKSLTSKEYFNATILIDIKTCRVEIMNSLPNMPCPRWQHSATMFGDNMFVYGGSSSKGILSDMHVFDMLRREWSTVNVCLEARKRHTGVVMGSCIAMLGGSGDSSIAIFDPESRQTSKAEEFGNVNQCRYSSSVVSSESAYIIAGTRDRRTKFSAVFVLNVPPALSPKSQILQVEVSEEESKSEIDLGKVKPGRKRTKFSGVSDHLDHVPMKPVRKGKRSKLSLGREFLADIEADIPRKRSITTPTPMESSLAEVVSAGKQGQEDALNIFESLDDNGQSGAADAGESILAPPQSASVSEAVAGSKRLVFASEEIVTIEGVETELDGETMRKDNLDGRKEMEGSQTETPPRTGGIGMESAVVFEFEKLGTPPRKVDNEAMERQDIQLQIDTRVIAVQFPRTPSPVRVDTETHIELMYERNLDSQLTLDLELPDTRIHEENCTQTNMPEMGVMQSQTDTPPRKVDNETMMEFGRELALSSGVVAEIEKPQTPPKAIHSNVIIDVEKMKTPPRDTTFVQTMTPPRKVDSETMMEFGRELELSSGVVTEIEKPDTPPKAIESNVIINVEKMKTPPRDTTFVQTMTPPRKVDNETMMDLVHERELKTGVILDVERPQTPPKAIHSNVIIDVEKMKTPPRDTTFVQTMTPPRKVDNETMMDLPERREIHTDFVAYVEKPTGPSHDTNSTQTISPSLDAVSSQTDNSPAKQDTETLTSNSRDLGFQSDVVACFARPSPPSREVMSSQTDSPPVKIDSETMMEFLGERQLHTDVIANLDAPKAPPRESMSSQTMTPPRKVDNETMMDLVHERELKTGVILDVERPQTPPKAIHSNVIIDVEKMKTPPRDTTFVQTMTPPRKVDSETMMEFGRELELSSGVFAETEKPVTPPKAIHSNVIIDVEKMKTPPRDTTFVQTMTPPRKVDNETMIEGSTSRDMRSDVIADVAVMTREAISSQTMTPPRKVDNETMMDLPPERQLDTKVIAEVTRPCMSRDVEFSVIMNIESQEREKIPPSIDNSSQTTDPDRVDTGTSMEMNRERNLHFTVVAEEKQKREETSAQTIPDRVDSETMMQLTQERQVETGVILDVERPKTPPRYTTFAQTTTPPRKVDNETMMEFGRELELSSGVVAEIEKPQTPPKAIHSDVIIDVEKMKTPPRDTTFVQTMTPPRKVDNETMMEYSQSREMQSNVIADMQHEIPSHTAMCSQTMTPPRKTDSQTMIESLTSLEMHSNVIADVANQSPTRSAMSSQTMTPPLKVDHETMPESSLSLGIQSNVIAEVACERENHSHECNSTQTAPVEMQLHSNVSVEHFASTIHDPPSTQQTNKWALHSHHIFEASPNANAAEQPKENSNSMWMVAGVGAAVVAAGLSMWYINRKKKR